MTSKQTMTERMWDIIVNTCFMTGHAHQHIKYADKETLSIVDDYGKMALWIFDTKNQKITLEEM